MQNSTHSHMSKYSCAIIFYGTGLHIQCQVLLVGKHICMAAKCWIFPLRVSPVHCNYADRIVNITPVIKSTRFLLKLLLQI